MLSSSMICRLPLRPHPRPALTPVLSITSTLPFSVDLQPIQSKRLAHSFKNIGGIPLSFPNREGGKQERLVRLLAEKFRSREPKKLAARRRQPLQFEGGDSAFLQLRDVILRADGRGDQIVELRSMAEAKYHGRIFLPGDLFEKMRWLCAGKKRIGSANLLLRIIERRRENFGRLHGAHIRAANQEIGTDFEARDSLRDLLGFLDAFFRQKPFGISRRFRIFAIDRDAVADDVQLHFLRNLLFLVSNIVMRNPPRSVRESLRCAVVIDSSREFISAPAGGY